MLTIRREQIEALRVPLIRRFHQELLEHVKTHFVEETEGKSDKEILEHIRQALKRAEVYGLKAERELYMYINVSMLYGADFDEQEETKWTADYLTDEDVSSPTLRMNRLYEEIVHRLEVDENNARIEKEFYRDRSDEEDDESEDRAEEDRDDEDEDDDDADEENDDIDM
jgi:hypothetical protein